ncbi:unnamed protein product [Pedinophyceae sp. YPF-701]|nr:unnamed protein product [Pedinophyceae sp. YPF-701]
MLCFRAAGGDCVGCDGDDMSTPCRACLQRAQASYRDAPPRPLMRVRLDGSNASRLRTRAGAAAGHGRRALLTSAPLLLTALHFSQANAAEGEPVPGANLPKEYVRSARKVVTAVSEAIEAEREGASETEVRRKAGPAQDSVKAFLGRYRDDKRLQDEETYLQISSVLKDMGQFYLKNGQRAKFPPELAQSILDRLGAAGQGLPPEDKLLDPIEALLGR